MKNKIKTIDVNAKEWFDKVNGNSYFAGTVTVNYGMKTEQTFKMPFQYGYGDSYRYQAIKVLEESGLIPSNSKEWELRDKGVIIRANIQRNCLKRELKYI